MKLKTDIAPDHVTVADLDTPAGKKSILVLQLGADPHEPDAQIAVHVDPDVGLRIAEGWAASCRELTGGIVIATPADAKAAAAASGLTTP